MKLGWRRRCRLVDLHSRVHRGTYGAKPSRRVFIPKADGRQRPLGVAALEDKIVQQAAVTILKQIHEVDFQGFSRDRKQRGEGKPETFTFLGFTHYCGPRHKSGTFTVWRITAKKRMVSKLKAIKVELQRRIMIATPMLVFGSGKLCWVITNTTLFLGTRLSCASSNFACAGYGIVFWSAVVNAQRCVGTFTPVLNRWIPPPRVLHPYPDARFYATHPS